MSRQSSTLSLRSLVEAELAQSALQVRFSPELEARYRSDMAVPRVREVHTKAIIGAIFYVLVTGLMNAFVVAQPAWLDLGFQLTITSVVGLLIIWRFCRPEARDAVREASIWIAALVFTSSVIVTAYFDPPETVLQNMLLVAVPVNFVLIFANLRFAAAVAFLIAALGLDALAIFLRTDIPSAAKAFPIGFMLALCGPTLFAVFSLERASRRNYLHALLQKLQIDDLAAENDVLAQISATDALTGIANRRQLDKELNMFCGQADPKGAFMLIDIDEFKVFNDQHGHLAGDIALRELASCLSQHLRRCDSLARYGGEEFAVVMPEVASHEAMEAAQRMRRAVECHSFEISGVPRRVTVSIGVADAAQYPDPTVLIGAADAALYTAKKTGRNRVCASWLQPVICQAV